LEKLLRTYRVRVCIVQFGGERDTLLWWKTNARVILCEFFVEELEKPKIAL
jgi:hypothetical protein